MQAQTLPSMMQPIDRPLMPGSLRDDPRHDVERVVALRFQDLEQRLSARSVNLSAQGMFIRSRNAQPTGSKLSFELPLTGAQQPLRGEGEIVWMRRFELGVNLPAGMGIRFLELDKKSRRRLRSFIAEHDLPSGPSEDRLAAPAAAWTSPGHVGLLSGLTSNEQRRLYSYAGCASAVPEWSHRVRGLFSRGLQAAYRAIGR